MTRKENTETQVGKGDDDDGQLKAKGWMQKAETGRVRRKTLGREQVIGEKHRRTDRLRIRSG